MNRAFVSLHYSKICGIVNIKSVLFVFTYIMRISYTFTVTHRFVFLPYCSKANETINRFTSVTLFPETVRETYPAPAPEAPRFKLCTRFILSTGITIYSRYTGNKIHATFVM